MKALALLCLLVAGLTATAQNLYVKTFGKSSDPAIVFLHGGPGYNCATFEATTAQNLADSGFYVIVYDRRGEGRSKDPNAAFTYQQSVSDLDSIISSLGIKRVSLIGHSFGGVIGIRYAEKFRDKTQALILAGAPINMQESFRTIISNCRQRAAEKNDTSGLKFLSRLPTMDTSSLMYSSMVLAQAKKYNLYSPKTRTEETKQIFSRIKDDDEVIKLAGAMSPAAPKGFYQNEHYTTQDMKPELQTLVFSGVRVLGIYGQEDGLYSLPQVRELEAILGPGHLKYVAGSSHNVFIDQQKEFISALKQWLH